MDSRPGRHARRGTFARDIGVAGVGFLVAAVGVYLALTVLIGGGANGAQAGTGERTEVAGLVVTAPPDDVTTSSTQENVAPDISTTGPTPEVTGSEPVGTTTTTEGGETSGSVSDPATIRVKVLNAVGTDGLASRVSDALASAGYQTLGSDDFGSPLSNSRIDYREGFEAAAQVLAERFPDAELRLDSALTDVELVVILGATYREE